MGWLGARVAGAGLSAARTRRTRTRCMLQISACILGRAEAGSRSRACNRAQSHRLRRADFALDVGAGVDLQLLRSIQASTGVAYLFITHDLAVARRMCDEIALLRGGRIEAMGTSKRSCRRGVLSPFHRVEPVPHRPAAWRRHRLRRRIAAHRAPRSVRRIDEIRDWSCWTVRTGRVFTEVMTFRTACRHDGPARCPDDGRAHLGMGSRADDGVR